MFHFLKDVALLKIYSFVWSLADSWKPYTLSHTLKDGTLLQYMLCSLVIQTTTAPWRGSRLERSEHVEAQPAVVRVISQLTTL